MRIRPPATRSPPCLDAGRRGFAKIRNPRERPAVVRVTRSRVQGARARDARPKGRDPQPCRWPRAAKRAWPRGGTAASAAGQPGREAMRPDHRRDHPRKCLPAKPPRRPPCHPARLRCPSLAGRSAEPGRAKRARGPARPVGDARSASRSAAARARRGLTGPGPAWSDATERSEGRGAHPGPRAKKGADARGAGPVREETKRPRGLLA